MKKWNFWEKADSRGGITGGGLFLLCMCNFGLLHLLIWLLIFNQRRLTVLQKEGEMLSQEQSYRKQYWEIIHSNEEKLVQIKQGLLEDFKGMLHLMEAGEKYRVMEILRGKREIVKEVSSFVNTRSMVANAAMNRCFSRAARHHIGITSVVPEDFTGIEEYDLSSLLTNMLDNAIEGCLQIPRRKERVIHLQITSEGEWGKKEMGGHNKGRVYIFQTENTTIGQIKRKNPTLSTTKNEKKNHGYGIGIIQDIAQKYHGNAEFFDKKDFFCCRVILFAGPWT